MLPWFWFTSIWSRYAFKYNVKGCGINNKGLGFRVQGSRFDFQDLGIAERFALGLRQN
jgi:hypothetical protein